MNKHDQRRRDISINALLKAKERLEIENLYLSVKGKSPLVARVKDALELVDIALEKLTEAHHEVI